MSGIATRQSDPEAEFSAIELAVRETERGRWFLNEFARRNRHADTEMLLSALSRIERSVGIPQGTPQADDLRLDILELSRAIARTRAEIAAIKPSEAGPGPITEASGELNSIVTSTESATSSILAAAEKVQAAASALREAEADPALCEALDSRATEIFLACSFQDLTAQRTRKVIETLTFIEQRLNAMADLWRVPRGGQTPPEGDARAAAAPDAMSQADVDSMLVQSAARTGAPREEAGLVDAQAIDEILFSEPAPPPPPESARLQLVSSQQPAAIADADMAPASAACPAGEEPVVDSALRKVRAGETLTSDEAARALDALQGLSIEERTRLFS